MRPARMQLTSCLSTDMALSARVGVGVDVADFRCSARRPDGPGAEPGLNDFKALANFSVVIDIGGGRSSTGIKGGGPWGCFSFIAAKVINDLCTKFEPNWMKIGRVSPF